MAVEEKRIGQLNDGTTLSRRNSIIPFEENGLTFRGKISELTLGINVEYIRSVEDFPTPIGGFIILEQDKGYVILNQIVLNNRIKFPAGWRGFIRSTNLFLNPIIYTGTGAFFETAHKSGIITAIADNGSGGITVSAGAHGLVVGEYVNMITAVKTEYTKQRLIIISKNANDFDVAIPFADVSDTGTYDTGALSVTLDNILFAHANPDQELLFDIEFTTDPTSLFSCDRVISSNYTHLGIIRNVSIVAIILSQFVFSGSGIDFADCVNVTIDNSLFTNTDIIGAAGGATSIAFTGNTFQDVVILNTKFVMFHPSHYSIFIDTANTQADFNITTCPDNKVSVDYFNPLGLNQKNKAVITFNNGDRQDSEDLAEVMSNGVILVTDTGGFDAIQTTGGNDNDFSLDSTSEGFTMDNRTGIVTYNGRKPKRVRIEYALEAQSVGPDQITDVQLQINTTLQPKTIRTMMTISPFVPISYLGGYFMISPGDTFQLYRNNGTNGSNTNFQNIVILVR